jgi:uncharacterized membrane protein YkvI
VLLAWDAWFFFIVLMAFSYPVFGFIALALFIASMWVTVREARYLWRRFASHFAKPS